MRACFVAADPAVFTSEAEVHSNASFPYDDIDEARPLASPGATAGTSGPVYLNKDVPTGKFCSSLNPHHHHHTLDNSADRLSFQLISTRYSLFRSTDETNYEVDDPQESYDDIEAAIPEVTQAEVHSTSQNIPENGAGLVAGGDNYLVPDQED